MPFNASGFLVIFQVLIQPRVIVPSLVIKDIRQLDFHALRKVGYRGAVFDKDNCLTVPHEDTLVPELRDAWATCKNVFGPENVLVVSNSAGTRDDPAGIQAESVTYHLGVPVLRHNKLKPSFSCIHGIRAYFASLPRPIHDEELVVIGDRVFTDVVLANRMQKPPAKVTRATEKDEVSNMDSTDELFQKPAGPLSILTTTLWKKESTVMRKLESTLLSNIERWVVGKDLLERRRQLSSSFLLPEPLVPRPPPSPWLNTWWK